MEVKPQTKTARPARPSRLSWKGFLWLLPVAAIIAAARYSTNAQLWLRTALDWLNGLGPWAPVVFIAVYVLSCVCFLPGSVLTLGAGASFGLVRGGVYSLIGATLGATCAFLVGRYLARDWVASKMAGSERFAAIDKAVAREGWTMVLLTRLSPLFPFNLLNYAFGVTQVALKDYVVASFIGMVPGTILYVHLGSVAGTLAGPAANRTRTPAEWGFYGVGLLATVAVAVVATRVATKALTKRIPG